MKSFILVLALISASVSINAQTEPKPATATADDAKAAVQVVESLFTAMKAKNAEAINALFMKDGQLVAIDRPRTGDGPSTTRIFTGETFAKVIAESKATDLIEQMKAKIDTPQGRQIYARRLAIVEPVFANLRIQKRLDHFTLLRGYTSGLTE